MRSRTATAYAHRAPTDPHVQTEVVRRLIDVGQALGRLQHRASSADASWVFITEEAARVDDAVDALQSAVARSSVIQAAEWSMVYATLLRSSELLRTSPLVAGDPLCETTSTRLEELLRSLG